MRMKRGVQVGLGDEVRFKGGEFVHARPAFVGDLNRKVFALMLDGDDIILANALGHAVHLFGINRNVRWSLRGRRGNVRQRLSVQRDLGDVEFVGAPTEADAVAQGAHRLGRLLEELSVHAMI